LHQVVEQACAIGNLALGEHLSNIGKDLDIYSYRMPLGVTAGICPYATSY
jgi:malonate-semialdehyde dehydrogenase (acetylating)/methylmalonate-semialdehyde dehydrogenase